ncbi:MAG: alpha/beta hydrolase, partial [Pseudomonadaceae bacterium]|nr:alpha/beta hydrolase [Pseudomonadaceae bacterium]
AENISTHFMGMTWVTNHGWEVFILDYRGYGLSEGNPSIGGVHHDAYIGLKWALARAEEQQIPLVVLGQSIGGATAITLVANASKEEQQQISGLVIDSAFSGYRRIAREKLNESWLTWAFQYPLSFTITDRYSPEKHLNKLPEGLPLLVLHSCADEVIPCSHSQRIYKQAAEPKTYLEAQEGRHIAMLSQLKWRKELMVWLGALF